MIFDTRQSILLEPQQILQLETCKGWSLVPCTNTTKVMGPSQIAISPSYGFIIPVHSDVPTKFAICYSTLFLYTPVVT